MSRQTPELLRIQAASEVGVKPPKIGAIESLADLVNLLVEQVAESDGDSIETLVSR